MSGWVTRRLRSRRLDVDAALVGLVLALGMFPLRFLASQIYIETIPIVLGVACALYLLAARSSRTLDRRPTLPPTVAGLLPTLAMVGIAALILIATFAGRRSIHFFDVASVVGTLLLGQILFTRDEDLKPRLLLGEIVVFAIVLRFAALYTAPGYIGIDIWTHMTRLTQQIYAARDLAAISGDKHYAAPFYHLLVVATSLLYDVSLRNALYLSLGIVMPISVLFVYSTTKLLVSVRWAIFAAMAYAVGDYVVEWGIHLIPTSMGLALFLGVVYALVRVMQMEYSARDFALLVLFSVAVILTHQVSSFIMLVVIGAGLVAQIVLKLDLFRVSPLRPDIFRTMGPVNLVGLLVFDMGFITFMWSLTPYNGDSFLETVLLYLGETIRSSAGFLNLAGKPASAAGGAAAAASGPTLVETVALYVDTLGFLILLCATFVGCLYVVRRQHAGHSVFTLLIAAAIMLVFVMGLPLFGIRNFIPQRWFAFLYAPMAILGAIGLRHLAWNLDSRVLAVALVLICGAFPGVMVMSSNGAIDNPVFQNERARLSYTESELEAVSTIRWMTGSPESMNIRPDQVLFTDHPYQTVFRRTNAYPTEAANVSDGKPVTHDITVYRTYQSNGASYFLNGNGMGQIRNVPKTRICRQSQSTVYANGNVTMCVASEETDDG